MTDLSTVFVGNFLGFTALFDLINRFKPLASIQEYRVDGAQSNIRPIWLKPAYRSFPFAGET